MSQETADVLAAGREYIEKYGWWKGGFVGPNGNQACVVGALCMGNEMELENPHQKAKLQAACFALIQVVKVDYPVSQYAQNCWHLAVEMWNDQKETTKQQVLDAMAKAEKIELAGYDPDEGVTV